MAGALGMPGAAAGSGIAEAPVRYTAKVSVGTRAVGGMRAFAVMHIVANHPFTAFDKDLAPAWTPGRIDLMSSGSMGLFYIISGFVLVIGYAQITLRPAATFREVAYGAPADSAGGLPVLDAMTFLRCRFARLAPMYYLMNLLAVVLGFARNISFVRVVLVLTCTSTWFADTPFVEILWTIPVVCFFYWCFPALAPWIQRIPTRHLRAYALGMYVLQLLLFPLSLSSHGLWLWMRMFPPARLPVFVMGMCCGMQRLHASHARADGRPTPAESCPAWPRLVGCGCLQPATGLALYWAGLSLACILASLACWMSHAPRMLEVILPILFYDWLYAVTDPEQNSSPVVRLFQSRPMVWLGEISMGIYMGHALLCAGWLFFIDAGYLDGARSNSMLPWVSFLVIVPTSVLLGCLLTRFYEVPMAGLLRPARRQDALEAAKRANASSHDRLRGVVADYGAA